MPRLLRGAALLAALLPILPVACGGDGGNPSGARASAVLGPAGGSVRIEDPASLLFGAEVHVPPGALAGPTEVSLEVLEAPLAAGALGARTDLGPPLQCTAVAGGAPAPFAKPVTLYLPFRRADYDAAAGGPSRALGIVHARTPVDASPSWVGGAVLPADALPAGLGLRAVGGAWVPGDAARPAAGIFGDSEGLLAVVDLASPGAAQRARGDGWALLAAAVASFSPFQGAASPVPAECGSAGDCTAVAAEACRSTTVTCHASLKTCLYDRSTDADGTACDSDDDLCNNEHCQAGACVAAPGIDGDWTCSQTEPGSCVTRHCDPATGQCVDDPNPCEDGNPCTIDLCGVGEFPCQHQPLFDDGNPCTVNCDPVTGDKVDPARPTDCDDGDACTRDWCLQPWDPAVTPVNPAGCRSDPLPCLDDGDPCTVESCDPATGCSHTPKDCDDGDPCTTDACTGGTCTHAATCDDGLRCTTDSCDPATGACGHVPVPCDDGDACTADACDPGTGGCLNPAVSCDDGDDCTADSCNPADGQCRHVATPAPGCEPPVAEILEPLDGAQVDAGARVTVRVSVTDDGQVARVRFYVDGTPAGSDATAPYALDVPIPAAAGPHVLGADAVDDHGRVSALDTVTVNAVATATTTVAGRVLDAAGAVLEGAEVAVAWGTASAVTAADGTFRIPGVAAALPLSLVASASPAGVFLRDVFGPFVPVAGGVTDAGDLVLRTGGAAAEDLAGPIVAGPVFFRAEAFARPSGSGPLEQAAGPIVAVPVSFGTRPHLASVAWMDGPDAHPAWDIPVNLREAVPMPPPGTGTTYQEDVTFRVTGYGLDGCTDWKVYEWWPAQGQWQQKTVQVLTASVDPVGRSASVLLRFADGNFWTAYQFPEVHLSCTVPWGESPPDAGSKFRISVIPIGT